MLKKDISPDIVKLLLEHGANLDLVYKDKNVLELAQENGNPEIIKLIEEHLKK